MAGRWRLAPGLSLLPYQLRDAARIFGVSDDMLLAALTGTERIAHTGNPVWGPELAMYGAGRSHLP
eukprot:6135355-Prymnesium_polylepis.1